MMTPRARDRESRKRKRHVGKHTKHPLLRENAPGAVFLASLVGAAPIVALFVIGPAVLSSRGVFPMDEWESWRFLFYVLTPLASLLALRLYRGAPPWAQSHNAARGGRKLAWANLVIWAVFGALYFLPVLVN